MPDPKPDTIALWISEEGANTEFRPLRDLITEVLAIRLVEKSEDERAELAESSEPSVVVHLDELSAQNREDGVNPRFEMSVEADTHHVKFLPQPELELLRELRAGTPEQFEVFCKRILDAIGANAIVQGGSADGGIDFFAFDLALNGVGVPSPKGAKIILVGQAKRYTLDNNVTEHDLRSFVGAATRRLFLLRKDYASKAGIIHPAMYTVLDNL